mmetsp:Transcript_90101/g.205928  ORF Transcript_90101/g.205928 Transcript_90101/m.205928 type:complete len:387 (-) Transcript_90101:51-1211(-)
MTDHLVLGGLKAQTTQEDLGHLPWAVARRGAAIGLGAAEATEGGHRSARPGALRDNLLALYLPALEIDYIALQRLCHRWVCERDESESAVPHGDAVHHFAVGREKAVQLLGGDPNAQPTEEKLAGNIPVGLLGRGRPEGGGCGGVGRGAVGRGASVAAVGRGKSGCRTAPSAASVSCGRGCCATCRIRNSSLALHPLPSNNVGILVLQHHIHHRRILIGDEPKPTGPASDLVHHHHCIGQRPVHAEMCVQVVVSGICGEATDENLALGRSGATAGKGGGGPGGEGGHGHRSAVRRGTAGEPAAPLAGGLTLSIHGFTLNLMSFNIHRCSSQRVCDSRVCERHKSKPSVLHGDSIHHFTEGREVLLQRLSGSSDRQTTQEQLARSHG